MQTTFTQRKKTSENQPQRDFLRQRPFSFPGPRRRRVRPRAGGGGAGAGQNACEIRLGVKTRADVDARVKTRATVDPPSKRVRNFRVRFIERRWWRGTERSLRQNARVRRTLPLTRRVRVCAGRRRVRPGLRRVRERARARGAGWRPARHTRALPAASLARRHVRLGFGLGRVGRAARGGGGVLLRRVRPAARVHRVAGQG